MSAEEAAARLGVKVETVYAYVSRGSLTSHRGPDGRRSTFDAAEVEELARRGRPRRSTRPPALDFTIESRLTRIGDHQLAYRDHDALELSRRATFEQVAELLWTDTLPERPPTWEPAAGPAPVAAPDDGSFDLLDLIRLTVVTAPAADPLRSDLRPASVVATARRLLATAVQGLPPRGDAAGAVPRLQLPAGGSPINGTLAGHLWIRLCDGRPRGMLPVLNAALVLLADHELASSTLAARIAASTRAPPSLSSVALHHDRSASPSSTASVPCASVSRSQSARATGASCAKRMLVALGSPWMIRTGRRLRSGSARPRARMASASGARRVSTSVPSSSRSSLSRCAGVSWAPGRVKWKV